MTFLKKIVSIPKKLLDYSFIDTLPGSANFKKLCEAAKLAAKSSNKKLILSYHSLKSLGVADWKALFKHKVMVILEKAELDAASFISLIEFLSTQQKTPVPQLQFDGLILKNTNFSTPQLTKNWQDVLVTYSKRSIKNADFSGCWLIPFPLINLSGSRFNHCVLPPEGNADDFCKVELTETAVPKTLYLQLSLSAQEKNYISLLGVTASDYEGLVRTHGAEKLSFKGVVVTPEQLKELMNQIRGFTHKPNLNGLYCKQTEGEPPINYMDFSDMDTF